MNKHLLIMMLGVAALPLHRAAGQSIEDRVGAARGTVGFTVETQPNVCGDGRGIFVSDDTSPGWNLRRRSGTSIQRGSANGYPCAVAPEHVIVEHEGARVTTLRMTVGGPQSAAEVELGAVDPAAALRFLVATAPKLDGRSGDDAVTAAAIADAPKTWPGLLSIARDDGASESARKSALFWVAREASDAAVAGLSSVADDSDATLGVRSDALFFLSQRKDGSGVDALIRVARKSGSMKLRKDAIWYLSQTRDPRALSLFEELLSGRK